MACNLKVLRVLGLTEDVIAEVTPHSGSSFVLKNPCVIMVLPLKEGETDPKIVMAPLLAPYMKGDVIILEKRNILFMIDPLDQVSDKYDSLFSSIIQPKLTSKGGGIIVP